MGHGDAIAMARYAPLLRDLGYDVRMEVGEPLVGLFTRSFPGIQVMPKAVDYPSAMGIPVFDYHIPMLSLPAMMKTDIDTVPWQGPYLTPDPNEVGRYRAIPGPRSGPRIGLCWSSGVRTEGLWIKEYGKRKSMHFRELLPLIKSNAANFISLQVGPEREQHCDFIADPLPDTPDWDDTAALVASLDLVITVDTSVAHLAGALGKPVWVMMHTEGSWHWMTERLDSPWYPTARLFRQKEIHQWADVVAEVGQALRVWLLERRS
jgi:hypothetical protein